MNAERQEEMGKGCKKGVRESGGYVKAKDKKMGWDGQGANRSWREPINNTK